MAAFARLLERLWPAREEEEAKEEEEEEGVQGSRRASVPPERAALRPAAARGVRRPLAACASGRARRRAGARTWRTRTVPGSRYPGGLRAGPFLPSSTATAGRERPSSARAICWATCSRRWAPRPASPRACAGRCAGPSWAQTRVCDRSGPAASRADPRRWPCSLSPRFLYLAHCGDSRAVLSRAGAVAFSTEDHRPLRPRERERIHDAGGTISRRRLEGSLAVSRALGDFAYKEAPGRPPEQQLVSAEPEVTALERRAEDEFMLLASDGVWDAMSGAALAGLVASRLCLGLAPELVCAQLLDTCLCKGSLDNMTCILVCFPGAPTPCEKAIRKERALDAALGHRVAELYSSAQQPPSLNAVFRALASEDIPDLPPGGGLYCKAAVIAEAYSQLCQTSGKLWEKGQNGPGKATGTHSGSALDLEA